MAALIPTGASALQIRQATDNARITATVSASEISRISVVRDRIRMVNGDPAVDITHDSQTGDVYLKPSTAPLSKPLNLFISTEKGFSYQLLLTPMAVPSEQILIRNDDVVDRSGQARAWESRTPFHATVVEVLKATIRGNTLPAGYRKKTFREKPRTREHLSVRRLYAVSGAALQGVAIEVRNVGETATAVSERDLYSPGQAAVYLPRGDLEAGGGLTAYVVRRRDGRSR